MNRVDKHLSIVVIDDHPLFRKGVRQLIDMEDHLRWLGEAANGQEGIALTKALQPDLVLLDVHMKDMNGIETLNAIKRFDSRVSVVMLTASDHAIDLQMALLAGADGYLLKDLEPEEFGSYLTSVAQGNFVASPSMRKYLRAALDPKTRSASLVKAHLTDREKQILHLLAIGHSNKLISQTLGITEGTVKVHLKHLFNKFNFRSRLEAAVWALQAGAGGHNVYWQTRPAA